MAELQDLVRLLDASLDRNQLPQAETALKEREKNPGFAIALLQISASQDFQNTSRLAAALCFKNFIRRSWVDAEGVWQLPENEVKTIKKEIVGLMIASPPNVQAQLGEAISSIADSDFPDRWQTLIQDLASRLSSGNTVTDNGVLQVAHSIFKRWRPLYRTDELFTEINHVREHFVEPFLRLLNNTDQRIAQNLNDQNALQQLFATLHTSIEVLYDLTCQDIPEELVEHKAAICNLLNKYLTFENGLLHTDVESEPGILENVKADIFELLKFWAEKYSDDFSDVIPTFVGTSWNMLTAVPTATKYDVLASRALSFLSSIISTPNGADFFSSEAIMKQIVERVILPNVKFRDSDMELFEDEPIEFIRQDLEGTDSDTRRRAATDFLRKLNEKYQKDVTGLVKRYIDHFLQEFGKDRAANWKSKDTAVYLFCSIGAISQATGAFGVRTTNPYIQVVEFFQKNVAEDLVSDSSHVLLKVDSIKFLYLFRTQLSRPQWLEAFPLLVNHLTSKNYVVYTYSAIAIERILYLNNESTEPLIQRTDLTPHAEAILKQLFSLIEQDPSPPKIQENEFLMRCVMRVLIVIREDVIPFQDSVLTTFIKIIRAIRQNPSNPKFYYYLFEGLGALIRFAAPTEPEKFETALFTPFSDILQEDVQEFLPYVFQLLAILLEANPTRNLSENYRSLLPLLLNPTAWEVKGYAPALTRFLSAIVPRATKEIVAEGQLVPILGVFQNLVSKKSTEGNAFDLLEIIVTAFPVDSLKPYFGDIFSLVLTRLMKSRTENLALRFVRFYHIMSARNDLGLGTDLVVATVEVIQQGLFAQLYTGVVLSETQKLVRPLDRKVAVVSFTKILADSQAFAEKYPKGWSHTCEALLKLMIDPPIPPKHQDMIDDQDADDLSFAVGFTQLSTCRVPPKDLYAEIQDVRAWIGEYLNQANARHSGRINKFIEERLTEETRTALLNWMQA